MIKATMLDWCEKPYLWIIKAVLKLNLNFLVWIFHYSVRTSTLQVINDRVLHVSIIPYKVTSGYDIIIQQTHLQFLRKSIIAIWQSNFWNFYQAAATLILAEMASFNNFLWIQIIYACKYWILLQSCWKQLFKSLVSCHTHSMFFQIFFAVHLRQSATGS